MQLRLPFTQTEWLMLDLNLAMARFSSVALSGLGYAWPLEEEYKAGSIIREGEKVDVKWPIRLDLLLG